MSDRRDRDRDRKRDRDARDYDRDRERPRQRHLDTDHHRDRKRSYTPDRARTRRSRSRSTDRDRRRSHHRTPSPDQSRKRSKHEEISRRNEEFCFNVTYLYNFAWAQAVQNKPLDDYLKTMNQSIINQTNNNNNNLVKEEEDDSNKIVFDLSHDVDSEKEEGEIQELTENVVVENKEQLTDMDAEEDLDDDDGDDRVKMWINVIRVALKGITIDEAKKSFEDVCSRLEDLLDTLSTLLSDNVGLKQDNLVKLVFSVIQRVNSVFCTMSQSEKEESRPPLSRVLTNVQTYTPVILSPQQLKEVETMLLLCNQKDVGSSNKDNDKDVGLLVANSSENANQEVASVSDKSVLNAIPVGMSDQNPKQSEPLKTQTSM